MKSLTSVVWALTSVLMVVVGLTTSAAAADNVLLEDNFDREESHPDKEDIGNGWSTNSRTRAKGEKQVDLDHGAMHITKAAVADHGVSVVHDVAFRDATIALRFKIGKGDDLGINIADMQEKSVHAGHICVARIRPSGVDMSDLKTGPMKKEHREARQNNSVSPELKKLLAETRKHIKYKVKTDQWHDLSVRIAGQTMSVSINGHQVGEFRSPGIGHETKRRLRLSVNKSAWVDDVKITGT